MFGFLDKAMKNNITKEQAAEMLKTSPEMLETFEAAYKKSAISDSIDTDNFFEINAKQASKELHERSDESEYDEKELYGTIQRIVSELLESLEKGSRALLVNASAKKQDLVTNVDLARFPEKARPQLTGTLMKRDVSMPVPNYRILLDNLYRMQNAKNGKDAAMYYHMFRQGLDMLDLDPVMYEMLGMNPNSIGHWFPALKEAVDRQEFFRVPKTKIIKVPLPILQLTRLDYFTLTPATLKVVDDFCMKAFGLDEDKAYFIKNGVYSSKFDFRNCVVRGKKEVRELGEYLLFIHAQASAMAHPINMPACIYGAATTNEWCVREYIEDKESNPHIYKGMPLHTEYRVFVDFDTDEVLGISPYWRPDIMKDRFLNHNDADSPHQKHDYVVYTFHEETLMKRYEENKDKVLENIKSLIQDMDLEGQWSIDVMQNGKDFWIIDMALAETSAMRDCIPEGRLKKTEENWIPALDG